MAVFEGVSNRHGSNIRTSDIDRAIQAQIEGESSDLNPFLAMTVSAVSSIVDKISGRREIEQAIEDTNRELMRSIGFSADALVRLVFSSGFDEIKESVDSVSACRGVVKLSGKIANGLAAGIVVDSEECRSVIESLDKLIEEFYREGFKVEDNCSEASLISIDVRHSFRELGTSLRRWLESGPFFQRLVISIP